MTQSAIRICQVGYLPGETKLALVAAGSAAAAGDAIVRRAADDRAVLTIPLGTPAPDPDSGDTLQGADLSALSEPGTYILDIPGIGRSDVFCVGTKVYRHPLRLAMRMFTGQRCGTAVTLAPDFPQYNYPACHTAQAEYDPSSGKTGTRDVPGGWHDAGDYGRYGVNSGITTGTLLWAYEWYEPALGDLHLDLPESGQALPDTLAEIKWNIDWMLTMQDDDGGVWHKATTARFPGFVMPEEDTGQVVKIIGSGDAPYKTTASTANLAAVAAIAARVYRPFDPRFADICLHSAELAWKWLAATPDLLYTDNPPGIQTGGYGDGDVRDERLWAAAELFRTTGASEYDTYFLTHHTEWNPRLHPDKAQNWADVQNMAMYTYALSADADPEAKAKIQADAVAAADVLVARAHTNGYRIPLLSQDYIWGSNAVVANYGLMLLAAHRFAPNDAYLQAARDILHYLFGRNTFGISFVTRVGRRWPRKPHHRPSGADGIAEPWPGMLVGGPNAYGQSPPARQWVDDEGSYTTNEVAINWNAPLVFLLAGAG